MLCPGGLPANGRGRYGRYKDVARHTKMAFGMLRLGISRLSVMLYGVMTETYFQKGFGLKAAMGPVLAENYASAGVKRLKELGYEASAGGIRVKLAREFGFCYGVDRAVQYAYETVEQFPDRRVFLCGGM